MTKAEKVEERRKQDELYQHVIASNNKARKWGPGVLGGAKPTSRRVKQVRFGKLAFPQLNGAFFFNE